MTPDYLLGLLVKSNRAFLKAQREYAACPGDPKRDMLKQSHQQEVRRAGRILLNSSSRSRRYSLFQMTDGLPAFHLY